MKLFTFLWWWSSVVLDNFALTADVGRAKAELLLWTPRTVNLNTIILWNHNSFIFDWVKIASTHLLREVKSWPSTRAFATSDARSDIGRLGSRLDWLPALAGAGNVTFSTFNRANSLMRTKSIDCGSSLRNSGRALIVVGGILSWCEILWLQLLIIANLFNESELTLLFNILVSGLWILLRGIEDILPLCKILALISIRPLMISNRISIVIDCCLHHPILLLLHADTATSWDWVVIWLKLSEALILHGILLRFLLV